MKQEIKDIAVNVVYSAPTSIAAWWQQVNVTTIIAIVLGVLQIVYLIRKWIREETAWGLTIKKLLNGDES